MGKLREKSTMRMFRIPDSHIAWIKRRIEETKEFDYVSEVVRYLIRQYIQRYDALPEEPAPKPPRRRASKRVAAAQPVEPPADTTSETIHPPLSTSS